MDWTDTRRFLAARRRDDLILLPFGLWLGRLLATSEFRGKLLLEALLTVPLVLPPTVLGFYLLVTFGRGRHSGRRFRRSPARRCRSRSRDCCSRRPLPISLRRAANPARLRGDSADVRDAASCCGWRRGSVFSDEVPLAWPSILTAAMLTFAHTLGEFGVVLMVGGNCRERRAR